MRLNWPARVALEYLTIAACLLAAMLSAWLIVPAMWIIGTRLHALAIIGHWGAHSILSPRDSLKNGILTLLCFAPLGIDRQRYKAFHFAHHRATGTLEDPERQIIEAYESRWIGVRWHDSVLDLLGAHADEGIDIMRRVASVRSIAVMAVIHALVALLAGACVLLLTAGMSTGFIFAHRLRARTEHDHLNAPGACFITAKPEAWRRWLYLPHYTWLHNQHHRAPVMEVEQLVMMKGIA